MAPNDGLKPTTPQKLAGRRIEPRTCVPRPTLKKPAAAPAAEPLDDPPGVRARSQGLRVGPGNDAANSVVTVLPRIMAPAWRRAFTLAESRPERTPANSGEPMPVGMSSVSITSLTPMGIPSMAES